MKSIKVTLDQVLDDNLNNPFWKTIMSNPEYAALEQDLDYILNQSRKHGKSFKDIDTDKLDQYDWKMK